MSRRYIYVVMLLVSCMVCAQDAEEMLEGMIERFEKSAVQADFVLSVHEPSNEMPYAQKGTFLMRDDAFRLESEGLVMCYDGHTQYVYMEDAEEISLSEPQDEELLQVNPVLMAKAMLASCDVRLRPTSAEQTECEIDFLPKEKGTELEMLVVKLRKVDNMLLQVVMISDEGVLTQLNLTNHKLDVEAQDADFVISEADYPNAILNDLR